MWLRSLTVLALALGVATMTPQRAFAQTEQSAQTQPAELFLFIYRPGPAWREGVPMRQQGLGPHAAYMQRLLDDGRVFAAGGFADDDGGMAIVRCASMEEAQSLIAADPAVTAGIFTGHIEHWRPRFRAGGPLP